MRNKALRRVGAFLKRLDYRHYICVVICVGFLLVSGLCFTNSFIRFGEGCRDFGLSIWYYFVSFGGGTSNVTVNDWSSVSFSSPLDLPSTWDEFKVSFNSYWQLWISWDNFKGYLGFLMNCLFVLSEVLLIALPFVLVFVIISRIFAGATNNKYNADTRCLRIWKKVSARVYSPTKAWLKAFVRFLSEHRFYWRLWLCLWLFNFNVFTIVLEFLAYYFYFIASFDFSSLYRQVCKLFMDLSVAFNTIPLVAWLVLAWLAWNAIRKKIAYRKLQHNEMKNRGLINELPIVTMICGTMGKKKTTLLTDMGLSQEIMFRDKAFEKLLQNDLKFPHFPWIMFENAIKQAVAAHFVYNLATCRKFVQCCHRAWRKGVRKGRDVGLFGYDYRRYGLTFNNGLEMQDIWKVLENYCQLYFIYVMECSLIQANYSVRTENILQDLGNFPLWHSELFKTDVRMMDAYSRHCHILDFDALRLGKKVLEDNKYANYFEFGVVLCTEIGKERGNALELREVKKNEDSANQKNDLFNSFLKMVRHSATVDNFPFVKIISDEQRPDSWGADARELCQIIHIEGSSETKLAMPTFALGELVFDWEQGKFLQKYPDSRFRRGDNTLPMHLFKGLSHKIFAYKERINNTFGYCKMNLKIEDGTRDGEIKDKIYYLSYKKIYSRRFATDAYSAFFANKALNSLVGLEDVPCYGAVKATVQEFLRQHSYFMADLLVNLFRKNNSKDGT